MRWERETILTVVFKTKQYLERVKGVLVLTEASCQPLDFQTSDYSKEHMLATSVFADSFSECWTANQPLI